jgi:hypothetical protein
MVDGVAEQKPAPEQRVDPISSERGCNQRDRLFCIGSDEVSRLPLFFPQQTSEAIVFAKRQQILGGIGASRDQRRSQQQDGL